MYKRSCGQDKVEHLGHIVTSAGVCVDPNKTKAMMTWPSPTSIKTLRGLLGLTSYCRRFVKRHGVCQKHLLIY